MAQVENPIESSRVVDEKINAAKEAAADRMGRFREKVENVAGNVRTRATEIREKFRETEWDDVMTGVKDYVKDNPGKSVAIALCTGFVLGLLVRRRDG